MNEMIENFVLGYFLSDNEDDLGYDTVIDSLADNIIPEGVEVWAPFEDFFAEALGEVMTEMYSHLLHFGNDVKKLEA